MCGRHAQVSDKFCGTGHESTSVLPPEAHQVDRICEQTVSKAQDLFLDRLQHSSRCCSGRRGKLVPWDYDADIAVWSGHWPVLMGLGTEIAEAGHMLLPSQTGFARIFFSALNGMYIDLYSMSTSPLSDDGMVYNVPGGMVDPFPVSFCLPWVPLSWRVCSCAPNEPMRFLETRYGPDFMTVVKKKVWDGPGLSPVEFMSELSASNFRLGYLSITLHRFARRNLCSCTSVFAKHGSLAWKLTDLSALHHSVLGTSYFVLDI